MQCYKIFTLCKWVKISFYNIVTPRGEYFTIIFSPRSGDIMGVKIISYRLVPRRPYIPHSLPLCINCRD